MAPASAALRASTARQVRRIGKADIVVGIPSYESARTISRVIKFAADGIAEHFSELNAVLVVSEGGSWDGTREVFISAPISADIRRLFTVYQGISGKGSALKAIFEISEHLDAATTVVVDADLRSITPGWMRTLANPVHSSGYGFVAPYYRRHKYDGTITNHLVYPLTRALYGQDIRQPIGGDFGVSRALIDVYQRASLWDYEDIRRFGIDIWMTTVALNEGFRVAQGNLGVKLHEAKDPSTHLVKMFREVAGTLFHLMGHYQARWRPVHETRLVDLYGDDPGGEPEEIKVNTGNAVKAFLSGCAACADIWPQILEPENLAAVERLRAVVESQPVFPAYDWARIVYDFAVAFHFGHHPSLAVESLIPLYLARVAAFVAETAEMSGSEAEGVIQEQALVFEREKGYLLERWRECELRGRKVF